MAHARSLARVNVCGRDPPGGDGWDALSATVELVDTMELPIAHVGVVIALRRREGG
jgi:hypothetical protein